MSDPVTQAEIEDVLSSIRRLVSEDGRSTPRAVATARSVPDHPGQPSADSGAAGNAGQQLAQADEAKPAPRLVLTPALRVADRDDTPAAEESAVQPAGDTQGFDTQTSDSQAVGTQPAETQPVETQPVSQRAMAYQTNAHVPDTHVPDSYIPEAEIEIEVEPNLDPAEVLTFPPNETPDEPYVAVAETEVTQRDPAHVADAELDAGNAVQDETAPWHDPDATLFGAVDPAVQGDDAALAEDAAADLEGDLDGSQRVSAVVQKIAELEAKVGRSSEQWEPDGASRDPYAGTNVETLEWQDHTGDVQDDADLDDMDMEDADLDAADQTLHAQDLAEEAVTEATLDALDGVAGASAEDSYLDEDSLRELVADIVRSELQGALGERITRNVRKLVRREIHRALAAQDLI